jgi:hypothetical protein
MLEGGYSFAALKGTTFMDPQVIADTALYLNPGQPEPDPLSDSFSRSAESSWLNTRHG